MSSLVKASPEEEAPIISEGEYCKQCRGYEECQYGEGGRGFEAIYNTYQFNGEEVEYKAWRKCRYKLAKEAEAEVEGLYERSGLPRGTRNLRIVEINATEITKRLAGGIVINKLQSVYIESATELAIAIGNELIKRRREVRYATIAEILTDLRYQDNMNYLTNLEKYIRVGVLIIEGLGSERWSEYNEEQLTMVLERRERRGLQTVISGKRALEREEYSILKEQVIKMMKSEGWSG